MKKINGKDARRKESDKVLKEAKDNTQNSLGYIRSLNGYAVNICMDANGRYALSGGHEKFMRLWFLDWELETKGPVDWIAAYGNKDIAVWKMDGTLENYSRTVSVVAVDKKDRANIL